MVCLNEGQVAAHDLSVSCVDETAVLCTVLYLALDEVVWQVRKAHRSVRNPGVHIQFEAVLRSGFFLIS